MSAFDNFIESLDLSSGVSWQECLFGDQVFSNSDGKRCLVPTSECTGKYIGLYFSAKWCGPCKVFTPVLKKFYEAQQKEGKNQFEIIFLSLDRTQPEFAEYYASMPWLSPLQLETCQKLAQKLGVMSIPTLMIISPEGKLMTSNGVAALRKDPEGKEFPWEGQAAPSAPFGTWLPLVLFLIYFLIKMYYDSKKKSEEE